MASENRQPIAPADIAPACRVAWLVRRRVEQPAVRDDARCGVVVMATWIPCLRRRLLGLRQRKVLLCVNDLAARLMRDQAPDP